MNSILMLIEEGENRRSILKWLEKNYQVISPEIGNNFTEQGKQFLENKSFDLCLLDFSTAYKLRQEMLARREAEKPVFLPFIFITSHRDVGVATNNLEFLIDDVIHIPIDRSEFQTKLRVYLRSRSNSLELKAAKEQLNKTLAREKELKELKSCFISMVSHEFRNPLNSISGMVQILEKYGDNLDNQKKTEVFQHLRRNILRMNQLLDDVLIIGRQEMGQLKFKPISLNLEGFCRILISEIKTVFIDKKQPINFVYREEKKYFNLDPKLLDHILSNLLSNACKYSPENSTIDFEIYSQNLELVFIIRDRGIGIPAKDLPKLFEPFYRASNVSEIEGTGLGLAIVKEYVNIHRGSIAVESQENCGTSFTITLPVNLDN
ncbi:MAG: ATP-binding protein [Prochloraceae cyanobacterium]